MSPANPIVSVIVPFYNQELYLSECLNSLAKQDFTNIEVVLIDDGSSDQSSRIARDYTKKDPRFRYYRIKHQGVAAARNAGLKHVKADLIIFCDSDDWMDPGAIQFLYQKMQENDADIVVTTHRLRARLNKVISSEVALRELFLEYNFTFHLWGKLYKRSLWQGIEFPVGHYYEDVAVGVDIFMRAKRIYVSSKHFYHYRNNPQSIIGGVDPVRRYVDFLHYAELAVQKIQVHYPNLAPYAQRYLWVAAVKAIIYTGKPKLKYRHILKYNAPAILTIQNKASSRERLCAQISQHAPLLASLFLIVRQKFKPKNRSAYRH